MLFTATLLFVRNLRILAAWNGNIDKSMASTLLTFCQDDQVRWRPS